MPVYIVQGQHRRKQVGLSLRIKGIDADTDLNLRGHKSRRKFLKGAPIILCCALQMRGGGDTASNGNTKTEYKRGEQEVSQTDRPSACLGQREAESVINVVEIYLPSTVVIVQNLVALSHHVGVNWGP